MRNKFIFIHLQCDDWERNATGCHHLKYFQWIVTLMLLPSIQSRFITCRQCKREQMRLLDEINVSFCVMLKVWYRFPWNGNGKCIQLYIRHIHIKFATPSNIFVLKMYEKLLFIILNALSTSKQQLTRFGLKFVRPSRELVAQSYWTFVFRRQCV